MANQRMFSNLVLESDEYNDMPVLTQQFYIRLCMRGDDDGFVNNIKQIQKITGAGDKDLELLIKNGLIIPFDSGVIVIRHWHIHNGIREDRKTPTLYQAEYSKLTRFNDVYYLKKEVKTE